jgi:hypothetical protein
VNLLTLDGERYLVAPRGETQWVRNLRANGGEATLLLGRRREPFTARELEDHEKPRVLRAYLKRWKAEIGMFFQGVGPAASDDELRRIAPGYPVFRLGSGGPAASTTGGDNRQVAAELELVVSAVTGALTGGAVRPLIAPADALAEYWKDKIRERLERVGESVVRKRGGATTLVNERIAYRVLTEAAFTDDSVVAEYLAGVIAGSQPDDDAGAPVLAQIARLSALQLRFHYVIYRGLWARDIHPGYHTPSKQVFFAQADLVNSVGGVQGEILPRLGEEAERLRWENLIPPLTPNGRGQDDAFRLLAAGDPIPVRDDLDKSHPEQGEMRLRRPPEPGLLVRGTESGMNLFLWGCGARHTPSGRLEHRGLKVEMEPAIPPCRGYTMDELYDAAGDWHPLPR